MLLIASRAPLVAGLLLAASTGLARAADPCPARTYPIDPKTTWWVAVKDNAVVGQHFRWPSADLSQPPALEPGWALLQEVSGGGWSASPLYTATEHGWTLYPAAGCAVYGPLYQWRPWEAMAAAVEEQGVAATEQCARGLQVGALRGIGSGSRLCTILDPAATDSANLAMQQWCDAWRRRCARPNLVHGLGVLAELGALQGAPPDPETVPSIETGWVVVPAPEGAP